MFTVNEVSTLPLSTPSSPTRLDAQETTVQTTTQPATLGLYDSPTSIGSLCQACEWDPTTREGRVAAGLSAAVPEPLEDAGVTFRHSGWQKRRERVLASLERIDPFSSRITRFAACGRNAWVLRSVSDPDVYRVACSKCRDRFCVPCASARGRRVAARVAELSKDRKVRLVTLTLRINNAPLSDQLSRLYCCYARLRRRKVWTSSQLGGIAFVEIKRRAESHTWHPHLHILTEGSYVPKSSLSGAWLEITGDSMIVDIKLCRSGDDAARYVAKYATKGVHGGVENDPEMLDEAVEALKGRRLFACFGSWSLPADDADLYPGEWRTVGTLRSVVERSLGGDVAARAVLDLLAGGAPCSTEPRSPPGLG